jgi:hypothetical protein
MTRKIGNFHDEKTGETHWLEPSTVRDYPLPPGRIAEFGHSGYRTVNYTLSDNETSKTIELVASVELSTGAVVKSDPVSMDENKFAELLFDAYVKDETFANKDEIKSFTEEAAVTLAYYAYTQAGIILDALALDGFGSVFYGEDRVATFDGIQVKIEPYEKNCEIQLINSVSQATLNAEKSPRIRFISKDKALKVPSFDFKHVHAGFITQYIITAEKTLIEPTSEINPLVHTFDDSVTPESPYMAERIALLASAELEDDAFEDRFGDIFQF